MRCVVSCGSALLSWLVFFFGALLWGCMIHTWCIQEDGCDKGAHQSCLGAEFKATGKYSHFLFTRLGLRSPTIWSGNLSENDPPLKCLNFGSMWLTPAQSNHRNNIILECKLYRTTANKNARQLLRQWRRSHVFLTVIGLKRESVLIKYSNTFFSEKAMDDWPINGSLDCVPDISPESIASIFQ